jgi:glutathione peroxidase
MKKLFLLSLALTLVFTVSAQKNLYSFKSQTIDGKEFNLSQLKGKKVMVVNVASKCGLTPQYKELQELYTTYGGPRFEIIAFPANNFLNQEPGTAEEIQEFCSKNYGVTFPIMQKISVKGDDQSPIYQWLTQKSENGVTDSEVSWNFQKFLIDEQGNLVKSISPRTSPMSDEVIQWIKSR